jgi:DNA-directed RNA polymerase specialized sigma24 family protein
MNFNGLPTLGLQRRQQQPDLQLTEEQDLIVRARDGFPAAIELLVSRLRERAGFSRLARNITCNHEDAEEVVQNAFVTSVASATQRVTSAFLNESKHCILTIELKHGIASP